MILKLVMRPGYHNPDGGKTDESAFDGMTELMEVILREGNIY